MASAEYMTGSGANDTLWSGNQGMGRMNLGRAFDGASIVHVDQTQVFSGSGQTFTVSGNITSSSLRSAWRWSGRTPGRVDECAVGQHLDLEVTINGTLYKGNHFSGAYSTTGGSAIRRTTPNSSSGRSGRRGATA